MSNGRTPRSAANRKGTPSAGLPFGFGSIEEVGLLELNVGIFVCDL
jgi:hypothetical protein